MRWTIRDNPGYFDAVEPGLAALMGRTADGS
jgi:hypothetical protein